MFDAPQIRPRVAAEIEQQRVRHMRQIATVVAGIMTLFVPLLMFSTRHIFSAMGLLVIGASGLATIGLCVLARFEAMRGHPQRACVILSVVTTAFVVTASSANPPTIIAPMFLGLPILIVALAFRPLIVKLIVVVQIAVAALMFALVPPPESFPTHILLVEFGGFYALIAALALASVNGQQIVFTQLDDARLEAEQASAAKSQFLANMSHELRTPLNAIIGYAELMQEEVEEATPKELSGDLQNIQSSGRYLLALISDVLDLSRIESNRFDLHVTQAPLSVLLDALRPVGQTLCAQRGNSFEITHDDGLADINLSTDQTVLRQILLNLLSNAAKFTTQGSVTLRVTKPDATHIRFEVIDTGAGIPDDAMERIFGEFEQVRGAHQESLKGTGLGLALVRRLSALLGGTVTVQSVVGQGSTFGVTLPAALGGREVDGTAAA